MRQIHRRARFGRWMAALIANLALVSAAGAASITIDPSFGGVESYAYDGLGGNMRTVESIASLPSSGSPFAVDGGASSLTQYTLTQSGFSFSMDQVGVANTDATAQTNVTLYIVPDADIDYAITGSYGLTSGDAPIVDLSFSIRVGSSANFVYRGVHSSRGIAGETHTLGQSSGNIWDIEEGSLTGTLLAGQEYRVVLQSRILSNQTSPGAATGSGYVTLAFVPEPSTALLVGLGLIGLASYRRARLAR